LNRQKGYMLETIHVIGSAIAIEPTIALQDVEQSPRSLDELLVIIGKEPTQYSAMLHTVARKFVEFTGKQPSEIPISDIATQKRAFAVHLRDGKYKAASIKSYRNYLNMLVRRAEAAGWDHAEEALRTEWEAISGMLSNRAARDLVAYASGLGRMPEDVNEDDLANWRKARISEGMQESYAARCCTTLGQRSQRLWADPSSNAVHRGTPSPGKICIPRCALKWSRLRHGRLPSFSLTDHRAHGSGR
jgi:hypothetical protein